MGELLIDTLYHYRGKAYLLHEFVIMPDHIHVLLTPNDEPGEGGSVHQGRFLVSSEEGTRSNMEVWQKGFSDHRIRDASDYRLHQIYIRQNPVRSICASARRSIRIRRRAAGSNLTRYLRG